MSGRLDGAGRAPNRGAEPARGGALDGALGHSRSGLWARLVTLTRAVGQVVRGVLGVPDYERYAAHVRARHPDARPVTREEFERERQEARYNRPGSRCC